MERPAIALTVDVEEYYQATVFEGEIHRENWEEMPPRVEKNTLRVLDLLDEEQITGTFFVVGWVAVKYPGLVREIQTRGHEMASHGYEHQLVYQQGPDGFRDDIRRSKHILEDILGVEVRGYRAPTFSITPKTPWAHSILAEEGYRYSSSVYPIRHDRYGWPGFPSTPTKMTFEDGRDIWELPLSTANLGNIHIPFGGGGYFRIYPYWLSRLLLANSRREPVGLPIVYFHPWEVDSLQPRLPSGMLDRIRHSLGLRKFESKLRVLFKDFNFQPINEFLQ